MWTFEQDNGKLTHDGNLVGNGYAGGNIPPNFDATAVNNPARQAEHCVGPLPRGKYSIGPAHTEPELGPVAMRLDPDPANQMFGRAGFLHSRGESSASVRIFRRMHNFRIIS